MKRKHEVEVTLVAETKVRIAVWVEDGDEPTDLTSEEERMAINLAPSHPKWEIDYGNTREVQPAVEVRE